MVKKLFVLSAVALGLSACGDSSSGSTTVPERDPATYWVGLVTERYGVCFDVLGVDSEPVYEDNSGENREGYVRVTANGAELTFAVGTAAGGANLTVPDDEETVEILDSTDC